MSEPSHRRPHSFGDRAIVAGVVLANLCAVTLLVAVVSRGAGSTASPAQIATPSAHSGDVELGLADAAAGAPTPIYRHSVIPGGVRSVEELRDAIGRDRVVADHYWKLSMDHVRVERLPEPRRAYVSYRIGDRVYWTKDKVSLPAGETILTDGVTTIRARCGNCVSSEPQLPTLAEEPDAVEFDALLPAAPQDRDAGVTAPGHPLSFVSGREPPSRPDAPPSSPSLAVPGPGLVTSGGMHPGVAAPPKISDPVEPKDEPGPAVLLPTPDDGFSGVGTPGSATTKGPSPGVWTPKKPLPPGPNTNNPHVTLPPPISLLPPASYNPGLTSDLSSTEVLQPVPVPEPSTIWLLATGAAGALWRRTRARRRQTEK